MTRRLQALALWMAVAAVVAVAVAPVVAADSPAPDVGATGWVKEKAAEAADSMKSWKDWAVGKFNRKWNDAPPTTSPTEKLGETKEKVSSVAADHAKPGAQKKHGPGEL